MDLGFAVFTRGGQLGLIDQGILGQIEASGGKPSAIDIEPVPVEGILSDKSVALGVETISAPAGDKPKVSRLDGILGEDTILE